MGYMHDKYGYEPFLRDCTCDPMHNTIVLLLPESEEFNTWRIKCDFCGNATSYHGRIEDAEFKWNEFQHKQTPRYKEEQAIITGWANVAETYEPRPLNELEVAQIKRAALNEQITERTPFVLGEPLGSRIKEDDNVDRV